MPQKTDCWIVNAGMQSCRKVCSRVPQDSKAAAITLCGFLWIKQLQSLFCKLRASEASEFGSAVKAPRAVYQGCSQRCPVKPCSQVTAGGLRACTPWPQETLTWVNLSVCFSVWGATIQSQHFILTTHSFISFTACAHADFFGIPMEEYCVGKCKAFHRKQNSS